ncbi:hypothetical protein PUG42_23460, partial [Erwiniaceae bacterium L1_54_3]|nr:hypothetical protein [Erwiniaceae bacterium L1_54_3]
ERSGRHDVAAEGTAKRREDGPAAAEVLGPALKRAPGSRGAAAHANMLNRAVEKAAILRKWQPHLKSPLTDKH